MFKKLLAYNGCPLIFLEWKENPTKIFESEEKSKKRSKKIKKPKNKDKKKEDMKIKVKIAKPFHQVEKKNVKRKEHKEKKLQLKVR